MYHRCRLPHAVTELPQFLAPKPATFCISLLSLSLSGSIFPTQHPRKKQEKRRSASSGVRLYPRVTSALLGSDVCRRGALGPNKAQIGRTISRPLAYLYAETGCLANRKHWRVFCKDCTDTVQEGKEDVQVMVCSWAVTNTKRILYWNYHMQLPSNISCELNLWFSAP